MGGSPSIPQRNMGKELKTLFGKGGWGQEQKAYNKWWQSEPLLSESHDFALKNLQDVGQLTDPLRELLKGLPNISGLTDPLQGIMGSLRDTFNNLPNISGLTDPLQRSLEGLPDPHTLTDPLQRALAGLSDPHTLTDPLQRRLESLGGIYDTQVAPTLQSGGALSSEQQRNVDQATRAGFAARGNVMGNQALGSELLNRDQYRQQRFGNALTQGLGISGEERGLTSGIEGIFGQDAATRLGLTSGIEGIFGQDAATRLGLTGGIQGLRTADIGNRLGLSQGIGGLSQLIEGLLSSDVGLRTLIPQSIQGLQSGALNQALGTEQSQVGTFATLMNPLLSYASGLNQSNQNAAATQSAASSNKTSGAIGSGASVIGSIAGAVGAIAL